MTSLAPHVTAFFNERLTLERRVSVNTCDSYAYAFQMLLEFASNRLRVAPSKMWLEQIDAPLVVSFLRHLETVMSRRNPATRSRHIQATVRGAEGHFEAPC
jgi:site-specific recombinase XerC